MFCMLISIHTFSAIKSLNNSKVKVGTEFSNVWGEYKNHSNHYIQGTTVPCDIAHAHRFMASSKVRVSSCEFAAPSCRSAEERIIATYRDLQGEPFMHLQVYITVDLDHIFVGHGVVATCTSVAI